MQPNGAALIKCFFFRCSWRFAQWPLNNPQKADVGAGYVYVGETSHPLEKRLQQHLTGESDRGKDLSSNVVKRYGVDLNLDLTPTATYLTKKQAQKAERRLADRLRAEGYCVEGGH